jgi:hypothetical protein
LAHVAGLAYSCHFFRSPPGPALLSESSPTESLSLLHLFRIFTRMPNIH